MTLFGNFGTGGWSARAKATELDAETIALREQARLIIEDADKKEAMAKRWRMGAVGEQQLEEKLRELLAEVEPPWWPSFDLRTSTTSRANIDAVVVGPAILILDAKNWSAPTRVVDGEIFRENRNRQAAEKTLAQGEKMQQLLGELGHPGVGVHTTVVQFGNQQVDSGIVRQGLSVCRPDELASLFVAICEDLPAEVLSPTEAMEFSWALEHVFIPARLVELGTPHAAGECPVCGRPGGLCFGPFESMT